MLIFIFFAFVVLPVSSNNPQGPHGSQVCKSIHSFRFIDVDDIPKATVVLRGATVNGNIIFRQDQSDRPVQIRGRIEGLDPSALRGFHVQYACLPSFILVPSHYPTANLATSQTDAPPQARTTILSIPLTELQPTAWNPDT